MTALTLTKADSRYYVSIGDLKVGWVLRSSDGRWWHFYATIRDSIEGTRMATERTRRDALIEGLSSLRIRHLSRVVILNHDTWKDEFRYLDEDVLKAEVDRLVDEKYAVR